MLTNIIKKLITDKILLGLVIVGLLLFFVGAWASQDDDKKKAETSVPIPAAQMQQQAAAVPTVPVLEPSLATDFVKWWMTNAMDYNTRSAYNSHAVACRWMTGSARQTYVATFWTPEISQGITSGQVMAAYQPASVQAEAINPDGTVVVGATGTLVIQSQGAPITQQVAIDCLVRKDKEGLRIAEICNRQVASAQPASPY